MIKSTVLQIEEASQVGHARRLTASMGEALGFDPVGTAQLSIVATELATNLVKHAGGGELIFRLLQDGDRLGLELLSLDKGPGIRNVTASLNDGYSTASSPGTGLGAIRRISTLFDLYSIPGQGTAILSRIWNHPRRESQETEPEIGVVNLPLITEDVCGDAWAMAHTARRTLVMVADGLGHGIFAAEAADLAVRIFEQTVASQPTEIIEGLHTALRSTRGAAISVVEILWGRRVVNYVGIGNVSGLILSGETTRHMVSHNGTAGLEARRIQEFTYAWPDDGILILYSDGIAGHWQLSNYPGLLARHPAIIAGILYRDYNRPRDDSTVVVIKEARRSR